MKRCEDPETNPDEGTSCLFSESLYEFLNGSRAVAEFLRSFGEADCIKPDLEFIAFFGSDRPQWLDLRGGVICLLSREEPLTYHPMQGKFDVSTSGSCANAVGSVIVQACFRGIFREADFASVLDAANSMRGVRRYIDEHYTKLRQRLLGLAANMNLAVWQEIADDMGVEREALLDWMAGIADQAPENADQSSGSTD